MTPAACHPERPSKARGLCNSCYQRARRGTLDRPLFRRMPPACHPDRPRHARALCSACYRRALRGLPICHPERRASSRDRAYCVECYRVEVTAPKKAEQQRAARWRRLYGITPEQYEELLDRQGSVCAICRQPPRRGRLHVDHDHRSGRVRGLLCHLCNRAIGALRDDPQLADGVALYLRLTSAAGASA